MRTRAFTRQSQLAFYQLQFVYDLYQALFSRLSSWFVIKGNMFNYMHAPQIQNITHIIFAEKRKHKKARRGAKHIFWSTLYYFPNGPVLHWVALIKSTVFAQSVSTCGMHWTFIYTYESGTHLGVLNNVLLLARYRPLLYLYCCIHRHMGSESALRGCRCRMGHIVRNWKEIW